MTINNKVCKIKQMLNVNISTGTKKLVLPLRRFNAALGDIPSRLKAVSVFAQSPIGIDIGSSYIKILQLCKSAKGYAIANYITKALPSAGNENQQERKRFIQAVIKQFVTDARIKAKFCRLTIWSKKVFVFNLVIPALKDKDLKNALSLELKKRLPSQINLNDVSFDFFITGENREETATNLQVTCIACDNAAINEQVQFIKELNLAPQAINVAADSLGNLLPFCLAASGDKTVVVLELGASGSQLNFYKGRDLTFSREIPVGGEQFTLALAKGIPIIAGSGAMSFDDAEKIKRNCGIPINLDANTEYMTDFGIFKGDQISTILRPLFERIIVEITRTFSYYTKTFKVGIIEELYLTGGGARLVNIDKVLLYNIPGIKKVMNLDTLKAIKGWTETGLLKQELVVEQAAPFLSVAFGLCLGDGGRVNLLPLKEKIEQKVLSLSSLLRVIFPMVLGLILSFYAIIYANALKYKTLISRIDKEISFLKPITHDVEDYVEVKRKLEEKEGLLKEAEQRQPLWWGIFKELSTITPGDVVLQKIATVSSKDSKKIHLIGKIFAQYTIIDLALSQYLIALDESPFFSSVDLVSSKPDMYSEVPAAVFDIVCKLKY